jgi:UDP-N-acetylmuramoylalanine--D-glutamate ligase
METNASDEQERIRARVAGLASWHDDWSGLRIAVLGLGAIGFSVADTLVELGSRVRVIHADPDPDRERLLDVIGSERFRAETHPEQLGDLAAFGPDLVIASPSFRLDHPLTAWAGERGIPVWGDIELGWRLRDKTNRIADWICIAGARGKTTTGRLAAHMLAAAGLRVAPAGDDEAPILDALRDPQGYDAIVVELSAVQLARLGEISPYASACLNFGEERGDTVARWAEMARVYEHTQVACVYNRADLETERMVEDADVIEGARAVSFGLDSPPPSGFGVVEEILVDRGFHAERRSEAYELVTLDELAELRLATPQFVQNLLAASALARARGAEPTEIAQAILNYHRIEREQE